MATSGAPIFAAANAVISHSGPVGQQERDPIAAPHAEREQRAGHVVDPRAQRGVGHALVARDDGLGAGLAARQIVEQDAERAGASGSSLSVR